MFAGGFALGVQFVLFALFPGSEDDVFVVWHRVRRAFLPIGCERELLLTRAIDLHAPDVHVAVDLTAKKYPLAIGRYGDFGFVVQVVSQTFNILTIQIGNIELGALRVIVIV